VSQKADIEARDIYGWTPLHVACNFGFDQCVELLLESGAEIRVLDKKRRTPYYLASSLNHVQVLKHLLKKDPDTPEKMPWHRA